VIFGVNNRDPETVRGWVEEQGFPFSVLLDPDRSIIEAYGLGLKDGESYLINGQGGRRPAVIIDEEGLVLKVLPDLATVDQQLEALQSIG
jgi:peroxiredoxin